MKRKTRIFRHFESFAISIAGHAVLLCLLLTMPMCRRAPKPEHKVYTFELIDPSQLTMRKPKKPPVEKPRKKKPEKKKKKKKKKKRVIKKSATLPQKRKNIEERINEQLKELDKKEWLEPSKLEELQKAKLLDTGTFANVWYNDAVASKIYQCWRTPSKALAEGEGLCVVVRFRIMRDGRVAILGVDRKSGNENLDSSALQAIKEAQPLPPLPGDYKGESLDVCMTFIPEE